jgi:hypothetical protein
MNSRLFPTLATAAAALLLVSEATAATIFFSATINGAQETPAVVTTGTGTASLTLDDVTGAWNLTGSFSNLQGNANNAHIHGPAPVGVAAAPIKGLSFTAGVTSGTISGSDSLTGVFSGSQMNDLKNGLYYVNVHSTFATGGEIRGQLVQIPEPTSAVLSMGVLTCALLRRRRR